MSEGITREKLCKCGCGEPEPEYEEAWAWPARNIGPVAHAHMGKDRVPERRRAA